MLTFEFFHIISFSPLIRHSNGTTRPLTHTFCTESRYPHHKNHITSPATHTFCTESRCPHHQNNATNPVIHTLFWPNHSSSPNVSIAAKIRMYGVVCTEKWYHRVLTQTSSTNHPLALIKSTQTLIFRFLWYYRPDLPKTFCCMPPSPHITMNIVHSKK